MPQAQREVIAYNITQLRKEKYPGKGGSYKCANDFKVPQSQWSPWETGRRTPDEDRMAQIASFFGITVAELKKEPDDWAEKRHEWLARKQGPRRKRSAAYAQTEVPHSPFGKPESGSDDDYMEAVRLLMKGQSKFDRGEIDPKLYASKIQSVVNFVRFTLGE
jgi:transcriptional regulator with XRE-family HTH domain